MAHPLDDCIAQQAVDHGWVSAAQIATAARRHGSDATPLALVLLDAGLLSPAQVLGLLREAKADGPNESARDALVRAVQAWSAVPAERAVTLRAPSLSAKGAEPGPTVRFDQAATVAPATRVPAERTPASAAPPRRIGKFELEQELGRGGMGVVYRARHPELQGTFAVKVLLAGVDADAEDRDRFQREAQAGARVRHPGIVAVHDFGVEDGKPWFAMEFVDGASLDRVVRDPTTFGLPPAPGGRVAGRAAAVGLHPTAAMEITRQIALAMQAAHACGVIHRDLKPQNVLRDVRGQCKISDFGLARLVEGAQSGVTRSGMLMGTPFYMSPEQARGEARHLDARSDVYQIGAILYELLTGRPPYVGAATLDVVLQILKEDPAPPGRWNPRIDIDAQTICLHALAREQDRRYQTAQALADDCDRYLAGEPILARPIGRLERAWRRVRRNPVVSTLAALAAAGLLSTGVAWTYARQAERNRIERNLADLETRGRILVDAALAWRAAGHLDRQARYAHEIEAPARELQELAPDRAEPWYHQGRMLRATGSLLAAEQSQDEAVRRARADDAPAGSRALLIPALYERAILSMNRWYALLARRGQELLRLQAGLVRVGDPVPAPPSEAAVLAQDPELAELRRRCVLDLEEVAREEHDDEARALSARAFAALLRGDAAIDAAALFRQVIARDPMREEAYGGLADLATQRGDLADAWRWLEAGRALDLGNIDLSARQITHLRAALLRAGAHGEDCTEIRARGEAVLRRLLLFGGQSPILWSLCADFRYQEALHARMTGADPEPIVQRALVELEQAPADTGTRLDLLTAQAALRWVLASAYADRGLDPEAELSRVRQACTQALAIAPEHLPALHQNALVELALARSRAALGKDARAEFEHAIEAFEMTIRKNPRCGEAAINLGGACLGLGRLLHETREDPEPLYRRALVALERAEQLLPDLPEAYTNQISVWRQLGELRLRRRQDPSAEFDAVRKYAERVLALQPRSVAGLLGRAEGLAGRAHAATRRGEDARADYAGAAAAFEQALAPAPGVRRAEVLHDTALCHQTRGDLLVERGQDATDAYRLALAGYDSALAVQPDQLDAWNNRSNVCLALARAANTRAEDATPWIQDGLRGFERILSLHPGDRVARFNRATAWGKLAAEQQRQGRDPRPGFQRAIAEFEELSTLSPTDAAIPSNLGILAQNTGDYLLAQGQDPTAAYTRAVEHYDRSLALTSGQVEVLVSRATAHQMLGDLRRARGEDPAAEYGQALADYRAALAADPRTWQAQVNQGILLEALGRPTEALAAFEAALAVVGDALPMLRTLIARARIATCGEGEAPWVLEIRNANQALMTGESAVAQAAFARGLAEAGPETDDTPAARAARMIAHYNLACFDATVRPGTSPPDPAARAAALASALDHLEHAVRLGWADAAQVEADADLAALHGDPRWASLLERLRAGGK